MSGASPLLVGQIAEYYLGGHGGIGVYQTFTHVDTGPHEPDGTSGADGRWPSPAGPAGGPGGNSHGQHPQRVCGGSSGLGRGKRPLQGSEAGNLMLSQPVTRQQLAAVLYRFAKLEGQT